jgi:membrane dipeptidase
MDENEVEKLLERALLVDGHNDLPWAIWDQADRDLGKLDIRQRQPSLQTDLPRLRAGGVGGQFWSVYVPSELKGAQAVSAVLEQIYLVRRLCDRFPDHLRLTTSTGEVRQAFAEGRIASLLGAEGGNCIDNSLTVLSALRLLGVRYLTLTHAKNVDWADSATDIPAVGGLTEFGRDVVRTMNRIGMLVDLSHVSTATMNAAIDTSEMPVVFTHSSCRALVDNPRNVPDDVLIRLRDNGGVCMVTFVPPFVCQDVSNWYAEAGQAVADAAIEPGTTQAAEFWSEWAVRHPQPRASLAQVADHIEHVREVAGIDHVGIGGDYDGVGTMPDGLDDVSCYPALLHELVERGWSSAELTALMGENVLRVLAESDSRGTGSP